MLVQQTLKGKHVKSYESPVKHYKAGNTKIGYWRSPDKKLFGVNIEAPTVRFVGFGTGHITKFPSNPRNIIPALVKTGFVLTELNGVTQYIQHGEAFKMLDKIATAREHNVSVEAVIAMESDQGKTA
jgi:hypothetical protein